MLDMAGQYICTVYGEQFIKEELLILHNMHRDSKKLLYKCRHCDKLFVEQKNLEMHYENCQKQKCKVKLATILAGDPNQDIRSQYCEDSEASNPTKYVNHGTEEGHENNQGTKSQCVESSNNSDLSNQIFKYGYHDTENGYQSNQNNNHDVTSTSSSNQCIKESNTFVDKMDEEMYSCYICGKVYAWENNRDKHLRSHTGGKILKTFDCPVCGKAFPMKHSMQQHQKMHGRKCLQKEPSATKDKEHVPHKPIPAYDCIICGKTFKGRKDLVNHSLSHSHAMPHKCTICFRSFKRNMYLARHLNLHLELCHGEYYTCNICGKLHVRLEYLAEHMMEHTQGLPHRCKACAKTFPDILQLEEHTKEHYTMSYRCNRCPRVFVTETELTNHSRSHHKIGVKKLQERMSVLGSLKCNFCLKIYKSHSSLLMHLEKHKGENLQFRHKYKECDFLTNDRDAFSRHIKIHGDEKIENEHSTREARVIGAPEEKSRPPCLSGTQEHVLLQCTFCKKCFNDQESLESHMENQAADCEELAGFVHGNGTTTDSIIDSKDLSKQAGQRLHSFPVMEINRNTSLEIKTEDSENKEGDQKVCLSENKEAVQDILLNKKKDRYCLTGNFGNHSKLDYLAHTLIDDIPVLNIVPFEQMETGFDFI